MICCRLEIRPQAPGDSFDHRRPISTDEKQETLQVQMLSPGWDLSDPHGEPELAVSEACYPDSIVQPGRYEYGNAFHFGFHIL